MRVMHRLQLIIAARRSGFGLDFDVKFIPQAKLPSGFTKSTVPPGVTRFKLKGVHGTPTHTTTAQTQTTTTTILGTPTAASNMPGGGQCKVVFAPRTVPDSDPKPAPYRIRVTNFAASFPSVPGLLS